MIIIMTMSIIIMIIITILITMIIVIIIIPAWSPAGDSYASWSGWALQL